MTHWVRSGNTARTLDGNLSKLKRFAHRVNIEFIDPSSLEWNEIKDMKRALKKIDPSKPRRATVLTMHWIAKMMDSFRLLSHNDYWRCTLVTLQIFTRILLIHCAMMRGCEHRRGLQYGDIQSITFNADSTGVIIFKVAERYSNKKMKLREARLVILPIWPSRLSAGTAMLIYLDRVHKGSLASSTLFCGILQDDTIRRDAYTGDKSFAKTIRAMLTRAGMPAMDVQRISCHSPRAGGATDFSIIGMSQDFIRHQGGWRSDCFMIYVRPQMHHAMSTARSVISAMVTKFAFHEAK